MLGSYRVYDAAAHVILAPAMWDNLPEQYVPRRHRPATFSDIGDMPAGDIKYAQAPTNKPTRRK
jgi:hypothetical protein